MTPEESHRLVEAYRDGSLTSEDAEALAAAIRAGDDGVRRELAFAGHLAQALDDADFGRSFEERVSAERGASDFVRAFERRLTARTRRVAPAPPSRVPALVAAALAIAVVGAIAFSTRETPRRVLAPKPEIVLETPREPEPELPAPPAPTVPPPVPEPAPRPREELPVPPPAPPAPPPEPTRVAEAPAPPPLRPPTVVEAVEKVAGVARFDQIDGAVFVGAARKPAVPGEALLPGESVVADGKASLLLPDGTRFSVGPDALLKEIVKGPKGTRVVLAQGTLAADVAKQTADQPLVFATPHGEARVLGTVLRLVVEASSTRLEVREGKVRLTRDGKSVDVAAGQYATAGAGAPLAARSLSPDEIVLPAAQARLTGAEWTALRDVRSLWGASLEAGASPFKVVDHVEARPSYATFTFYAPADKEYRIWVRGTSVEKGDAWNRDMVTIEPTRATLSQKSPFFGTAPTTAYVFTGLAASPGYTWLSGHGEEAKAEAPPLVVRFSETGLQNIRLYVGHPWVRIDALWLSATQKTRPAAKTIPPLTER